MQYPTKLGKDGRISVPKSVREFLGLNEGDDILVDVRGKDEVGMAKRAIEKPYRRE